MSWLPFALGAYLVWAACNIFSKILISRYVNSVIVNLFFFGIWNFLPLVFVPSKGLIIPSPELLILSIASGLIFVYILIPYFKALAIEEASRVVPIWRFTPLFILLFSMGLTGEALTSSQWFAFLLLVVGGFLVSIKNFSDFFHPTKAFYLMIFSSVLSGLYTTIAKYIYLHLPYYDAFTLMRLGVGLHAIAPLLLSHNRQEVIRTFNRMKMPIKGLLLATGLLEFLGLALYNYAMSVAPASLVSASAGIQVVFVLLFSIALSVKFPQFIEEDISRGVLTQKGVAIALIVIGTGLISFH